MSPDVIFGSIGVVLFAAIAFEVWKYVRGHPQALASVEKELVALKGKVEAAVSTDAIHAKLDALTTKVDATHAAALAPVTVTVVPATSTAPEASITDKLFPQASPAPTPTPAPSPATDPARNGSDFAWTNGEWLWCSVADKVFTVSPPPGYAGYFQVHSGNAFGPTPTGVTYTVGGVTRSFGPNFQQWDTNAPDFPKAVLSAPFTITVHQDGTPGNLQVSINHS